MTVSDVAGWIAVFASGGAAAASTYLFFGAYHYQWRRRREADRRLGPFCPAADRPLPRQR